MSGGNLEKILRLMTEKKASDVFLSAKTPILIKINGQILQLSDQPLTPMQPRQLLAELLTPTQLEELEETGELNVGVGLSGIGSFRLSGVKQRGTVAAVFRCIPHQIPSLDSLSMPAIISTLATAKRGLVLLSCGVYANVIRILVPLTASDALLDEGMAILAESLAASV